MEEKRRNGETNLEILMRDMNPLLNEGEYVFASVEDLGEIDRGDTLCEFKEEEGITVVLEKGKADQLGLGYVFVCSWITLHVHSSLEAVGLTAAFSKALAQEEISCNVIAGLYHDHIFVGTTQAMRAMEVLNELSAKHTS